MSNLLAQNSVPASFNPKFIKNDKGGKIIFCHEKKQIEVNLFGKQIEKVETATNENQTNTYFVSVDKIIFQATLIPIPEHIQKVYNVKNLTSDQQLQILQAYMDYEIDYLNGSDAPGAKDINQAEGYINSRKHLIWNYFYKRYKDEGKDNAEMVWGQFCLSTIVFDQILTISIPLSKTSSNTNPVLLLKQIIENLYTYKKRCD